MNTRQAAIERMNTLGERREPFLFLIDFEEQMPLVLPLSEVDPAQLWYDFSGNTNAPSGKETKPKPVDLQAIPLSFDEFVSAFNPVQRELQAGNTFLLNLTASTRIECSLTFQEIFQHSQARYKLWWRGLDAKALREVHAPPKPPPKSDEFICFSPEPFVRVEGNRIATFPMKGTLPAHLPDARQQLLADKKEEAEHYTIVDLLRNDLSQVAKRVRVERFRYIEEVATHGQTLLQISSEISGELPKNWPDTLGDWFFKLLPAGSVSGAPKRKTLEIIRTVEGKPRGFYTGVGGIFNGNTLDSGVLIRFIEKTPDGLAFRSGGGITFQSDAGAEYRELLDKIYVPIPRNHPVL
ncbi:MAG: aminodeoxychorismate synthase component I [Cytophagaceae bacterium]|nr:aminodeoxychorismate synthase component I [Cytophagaceae bacterium]